MNLASTTSSPTQHTPFPEHLNSSTHQGIIGALTKRPMTSFELLKFISLTRDCIAFGKCMCDLLDAGAIVRHRIAGRHTYRYFLAEA